MKKQRRQRGIFIPKIVEKLINYKSNKRWMRMLLVSSFNDLSN